MEEEEGGGNEFPELCQLFLTKLITWVTQKQDQRSTAPIWYKLFSISQLVSASDFQSFIISFSVSVFQFCFVKFSQWK